MKSDLQTCMRDLVTACEDYAITYRLSNCRYCHAYSLQEQDGGQIPQTPALLQTLEGRLYLDQKLLKLAKITCKAANQTRSQERRDQPPVERSQPEKADDSRH